MSTTRIALYGGSFDPPHLCHVLAATFVLCQAEVDELRLIPTYRHPFDKPMSAFTLRCEMTRAAVAHLGPRVIVDPLEESLGGVSYTIHTVQAVLAQHPNAEILWVGGADIWHDRHRWRAWDRLQDLITPFIVGREGIAPPDGLTLETTLPAVSSTAIREAIRAGQPVDHLVSPAVLELITAHGLYR